MQDALTQFLFDNRSARGALVDIRSGLDAMLASRHYAADVRQLLGEALAASPLLASHLKFEGRINLQFQGDGPIKLLVTQIDERLRLRGMAKAVDGAAGAFPELLGGGTLALMLEPKRGGQRYQALVSVAGQNLASALERYYDQSEQLPTLIRLAAADGRLVGLLLQRLPGADQPSDYADWDHLASLLGTLQPAEMLQVAPDVLLRRLFHAERLRLFDPRPVQLACNCSRASISEMLLSLGVDDLQALLTERGRIEVTCEFCGRERVYSEIEIRGLLEARAQSADGAVRH